MGLLRAFQSPLSVALGLGCFAASSAAQAKLHTFRGETPTGTFGYAVDTAGDLDRDGLADVLLSGVDYGTFIGYARAYSGRDGSTLWALDEGGSPSGLGSDVAGGGDANGDGWPDLIVGAYWASVTLHYAGAARVYSGKDGTLLHEFVGGSAFSWFGLAVDWIGDVDQDGHDDLIIGGFGSNENGFRAGKAEVFSGRTGQLLYAYLGDQPRAEFGRSVSALGDVDDDGVPDFMIGGYDSNTPDALGVVRVYSGRDGTLIRTHHGNQYAGFGQSVADLGDIDGDGRPDYAVGAHLARHPSAPWQPRGNVQVYSGADGSLLYTFWGAPTSSLGFSVAGPGDFDGDGVPDILVGAPSVNAPGGAGRYVVVYSGADGSVLHQWQEDGGQFGNAVGGAGDVNADGFMDLLVADYKNAEAGPSAGIVYVLAGGCPEPETYCLSMPNSVGPGARIGMDGGPGITVNNLALSAEGVVPGQTTSFFYGDERAQLPFGSGWRCVGGVLRRVGPALESGPDGTVERRVDLHALAPIEPGTTWHFQAWYRDPQDLAGFNLSDALSISFCL